MKGKVLCPANAGWLSLFGMDDAERQCLTARFIEIESELAEIRVGRVVDGAPADVEFALLMEQDEIEFELGVDYIERRGAEQL
jgi:hypothetical protein